MATLYDLAMQYLNQSLPKTFKYDRTNQPGTTPPVTVPPQDPNAPVKRILPVQGGGDGFSVYNPDPNSISNKNYSPYAYRQAAERNLIGDVYSSGTAAQKMMDNYPDYYTGPQLTGIPGAIQNYAKNSFLGKGLDALGNMLPVNKRAILENELSGQGIMVNDIGQIVQGQGDYNTAQNIMAGYNANMIDADTIQNRIDTINDALGKYDKYDEDSDEFDPGKYQQMIDKLSALDEFAKIQGIAIDRKDIILDYRKKQKEKKKKDTTTTTGNDEDGSTTTSNNTTNNTGTVSTTSPDYTPVGPNQPDPGNNNNDGGSNDNTGGDPGSEGAGDTFGNRSGRGRTGYFYGGKV